VGATGRCRAAKLGDAGEQREPKGNAPIVWLARRIENFMLSSRRESLPVDYELVNRQGFETKQAAPREGARRETLADCARRSMRDSRRGRDS